MVPNPPNRPRLTAAAVLASANSIPSVPDVIANMAGSISGEASQKAMTAESGAPIASKAAMNGMTSQEQNGDKPPSNAANRIMRSSCPMKARASRFSAPVALRKPIAATANRMKGAVPKSAPEANVTTGRKRALSITATANRISTSAVQALSMRARRAPSVAGDWVVSVMVRILAGRCRRSILSSGSPRARARRHRPPPHR